MQKKKKKRKNQETENHTQDNKQSIETEFEWAKILNLTDKGNFYKYV